jgi:hypothetical protein
MRATQGLRGTLGEPDVREVPLFEEHDEVLHGLFDRYGSVDARRLVEVYFLVRAEVVLDVEYTLAQIFWPIPMKWLVIARVEDVGKRTSSPKSCRPWRL